MRTVLAFAPAWVAGVSLVCACSKVQSSTSGGEGGAPSATTPIASLAFLNGFEGEIDAFIKESGEPPKPVAVLVKGNKLRVDLPESVALKSNFGANGYVIFDSPAKKISFVSDAQRQVIVIDLTKGGEQLKGFAEGFKGMEPPHPHTAPTPQKPPPKVTKTGKFDTVAGYKCENWDITTTYREGTVCVANEGASWFSLPTTGIPTEQVWMAELFDGKHFPLRYVSYAEDGATEKSRGEVTKIDKKAPAASQFEYPPNYRVIDLAQMFHGLAGVQSGMPMLPHPLRGKKP
jgi:hypothetical protein